MNHIRMTQSHQQASKSMEQIFFASENAFNQISAPRRLMKTRLQPEIKHPKPKTFVFPHCDNLAEPGDSRLSPLTPLLRNTCAHPENYVGFRRVRGVRPCYYNILLNKAIEVVIKPISVSPGLSQVTANSAKSPKVIKFRSNTND